MPNSSNSHGLKNLFNKDAEVTILPTTESPFSLNPEFVPLPELITANRRLILLYELGRQICSETDDQRIFGTILAAVSKLLNSERAFIATFDRGQLKPQATYHIDLTGDIKSWPVSTTMLQRVLQEGISLLTTDATHDTKYGSAPSIDFHNIRSVICCPFGKIHHPKGLIYVDNRLSTGAFSRSDLEFLNALSHYAFLAIETTQERQRISADKELAEARWNAFQGELDTTQHLVAVSSSMVTLYQQAKKVAHTEIPVMLVGETGTGKEVFARLIHESSTRARGPFIPVHVGSLAKSVVESELFGHEKGAFTGANQRRIGRFELAHKGTLFLDELLDIPMDIQPKLLRVLEQKAFERLGGNKPVEIDVRFICACNKPPENLVNAGLFREDLLYRLNSVVLEIPALRNHREDIVPLVDFFLKQCHSNKVIDEEALDCLKLYNWPGNIRELKNCVEALIAMCEGNVIHTADLPPRLRPHTPSIKSHQGFEPLADIISRIEREQFLRAIELADGNNEKAIKLLGISRAKFFQRKKEFGLR